MQIEFYKYHGLGNDFIILDLIKDSWRPSSKWIKHYANRHMGVGFDQALLLLPDDTCSIINCDGSIAGQCGNGMRCIADYLFKKTQKEAFKIKILNSQVALQKYINGEYKVSMGKLRFIDHEINKKGLISTPFGSFKAQVWDIGNLHISLLVSDFSNVKAIGSWLQDNYFLDGVNVGFAIKEDFNSISLQVFERGAGLTNACASGACCAVKFLNSIKQVSNNVTVNFNYGSILVDLLENNHIAQTGSATFVYRGYLSKENSF